MEDEDAGDDDVRGKTHYGRGVGRAAGLWQDWEQEAIYRMRRTGQVLGGHQHRGARADAARRSRSCGTRSSAEVAGGRWGVPADLPNAEEDAKKKDVAKDDRGLEALATDDAATTTTTTRTRRRRRATTTTTTTSTSP